MEVLLCKPGLDTRIYNLILVGVVEKGFLNEALVILRRFMLAEDVVWSKDTYIGVFGLCARLKDLNLGRQVHNKLLKSGEVESDDDDSVCNAVMKMYGKCKDILSVRKVFDRCKDRNVVIWTTMLAAYMEHGSLEDSLKLFSNMQHEGVFPNTSTIFVLLTVSVELFSTTYGSALHALAIKAGFEGLKKVNKALINMYSITGDIKAAEKVAMSSKINSYNNRDMIRVEELISDDVATKVSKRELLEKMDIKKECGWSWIEIGDETYTFTSVRKGDPTFVSIHREMKVFLGCINFFNNVHDEDIEDMLKGDRDAYHSEEIALAYGLLKAPNKARICIIKASGELICGDCHTLMK